MTKHEREERNRRKFDHKDKPVDTAKRFDAQRRRFKLKFGRAPRPGEPVFFDPDHPTPRHLQAEPVDRGVVHSMYVTMIPLQVIHAYERTGMVISESNKHLWSGKDQAKWNNAIEEYFSLNPKAVA